MQQMRETVQSFISQQLVLHWTLIQNPILGVIAILVAFYWILAILRTIKDISSRTNNLLWQIMAILVVGVGSPFLWLPIYLLLRPLKYKWERISWRESLVVQTATCPSCGMKNPLHHDFCVTCGQKMVVVCKECKAPYHRAYDYCPQCGAPNIE